MKYILTTFAFITALLCLTPWVQAVEVGDIFYHDGSFDKTVKDDKVPVGLVYWVSERRDHGYIMTLDQPAKMTYVSADSYCNSYVTLGTDKGEWKLPTFIELLRMGNERINGVSNTKFTTLNNKLKTLPTGQALVADELYWIRSRAYALTYLNKFGFSTNSQNSGLFYPRCMKGF